MATTFAGTQIAVSRPCISSSQRFQDAGAVVLGLKSKVGSWNKLVSACRVSSVQPFQRGFTSPSIKFNKINTKAMAETSENKPVAGLPIDLKEEVGNAAAFLASPLASAITGAVVYVDNGLNAMGVGVDSPILKDLDIPEEQH